MHSSFKVKYVRSGSRAANPNAERTHMTGTKIETETGRSAALCVDGMCADQCGTTMVHGLRDRIGLNTGVYIIKV